MENVKFRSLNLFEYIVFIHSLQLASGMLIMPSPLANTAGTDGWISIILGWMITSMIGVLIILVLRKNSDKDFLQIVRKNIFYSIYYLFIFCWI